MQAPELLPFIGREDVYAKQLRGGGYLRVDEPITSELLWLHLCGDLTIGAYTVFNGHLSRYTCIDIDEGGMPLVKQVTEVLDSMLLDYVVEFSGRKGHHIWLLYADPIEAELARNAGLGLVRLAKLPPWDPRPVEEEEEQRRITEVFPKQGIVDPGSYGNLVKLPAGIHQVNGRRSEIIRPVLRPSLTAPDVEGLAAYHVTMERQEEETRSRPTGQSGEFGGFQAFIDRKVAEVASATEGGRNHTLYRAACSLFGCLARDGADEEKWNEITDLLVEGARECGLGVMESNATLASARRTALRGA